MNVYKQDGREVMIKFTCGRCGKNHIEPYSKQAGAAHEVLACFNPPAGWQDGTLYSPLLCDTCAEAFKSFLRGDPAALPLNISPQTAAAMQEMGRQAHGLYFDEDDDTSGLLEED